MVVEANQHSGRRHAAFSLVEILIAIGVIAVLATIGVLGYNSLNNTANKKQCYAILAAGESLVKELSSTGSFSRLEGPSDLVPPPIYVDPAGPTQPTYASPGNVVAGQAGRTTLINHMGPKVMNLLLSIPANKTRLSGMPRDSTVQPPPGSTTPYPYAMLADPWENPILLVPSGGLTGVKTSGGSGLTIKSPDGRPFWASAGPDGNFTEGDDNLYSFDK